MKNFLSIFSTSHYRLSFDDSTPRVGLYQMHEKVYRFTSFLFPLPFHHPSWKNFINFLAPISYTRVEPSRRIIQQNLFFAPHFFDSIALVCFVEIEIIT